MKKSADTGAPPCPGRRDVLQRSSVAAAGASLPPLVVDQSTPWWLQNNFGPVFDELSVFEPRVRGHIPEGLNGLYVRNGSNPRNADSRHWFFGDGMVHGVRFENGSPTWYGNRYVQTPLYALGVGFGDPNAPPFGGNNQSNVSAVYHAGKLYTSGEIGFPYLIDPQTLATLGVCDFEGVLKTSFTAHPKIDPATGYMHFFGYWFLQPYLTYGVVDARGRIIHSTTIDVGATTMIHSFAITERDVVFWELPVVFSLDQAVAGVANPFRWQPDYGARIGIMPLGGAGDQIRWVEIDPCFVYHEVNAFRDGDTVVIDVCRHNQAFGEADAEEFRRIHRWRIDTSAAALRFRDEKVLDREFELPSHDQRFTGRRHRYGWFVDQRKHPDTTDLAGIGRMDFDSGQASYWDPGSARHANEALFVPRGSAEGDGWLLSFVHDRNTDESVLAVLDAQHVEDGPIGEVVMPRAVPHGFHAAWVPADANRTTIALGQQR